MWEDTAGGALPPAQAPLGQLHLGQPMVTEHSHSGDGGQRSVPMWELEHFLFLGVNVEVFCICTHLHLRGRESGGVAGPQPERPSSLSAISPGSARLASTCSSVCQV